MPLRLAASVCQTQRVLIGLFPELDAPGGIQRAGRHFALVLSEFAASKKWEYRFLSLNDSQELHRMKVGEREYVFTGAARGKARFATSALKAAGRKPKLVLAAHANLAPIVRSMNIVAPRMKSIVCTYGIEVWEPLSSIRRRSLRRATLVLAISRATADYVTSVQGVAPEKVRVLPLALDPGFETRMAAHSAGCLPPNFPQGRVILTVGRWLATERYKGMDTLIQAMPRLLLRWPDVQLVMAGAGDDREWLINLARDSGVQRHVHFLSGLTDAELSACYAAAELFALPSRGEGFGMVYLEAMARGKPVIGGAHGGAPEVIRDGVTGYLVQHGDTVQLATSIDALLSNPELAREMGRRGRERVENDFRFQVFAKALRKILRELCES
ncbi:MAG TPA: glycosyltransferase family 4 protein [Candidatus Eremiobacteraceae bacterium]|nr:glycosyltransferase family 4 protein [Candidatus Eremiobacteraceae bacterium]